MHILKLLTKAMCHTFGSEGGKRAKSFTKKGKKMLMINIFLVLTFESTIAWKRIEGEKKIVSNLKVIYLRTFFRKKCLY